MKPDLGVVKRLAVVNYQDIPGCLRELANRIEAGKFGPSVNVAVVVGTPGSVRPSVYGLGEFDPVKTVGMLQSAVHCILTCREPVRDRLEKNT